MKLTDQEIAELITRFPDTNLTEPVEGADFVLGEWIKSEKPIVEVYEGL